MRKEINQISSVTDIPHHISVCNPHILTFHLKTFPQIVTMPDCDPALGSDPASECGYATDNAKGCDPTNQPKIVTLPQITT